MAADTQWCEHLSKFNGSMPTKIDSTEFIVANVSKPWLTPKSLLTEPLPIRVSMCRVVGKISPVPSSSIGFELWLPMRSMWNSKFHGTAAGGSTGAISYGGMVGALEKGYAAMGHDNGHRSKNLYEQSWSFNYESRTIIDERLEDFTHRAQHVATVISKEILKEYYEVPAKFSYYNGCSQGGHHGLMEAKRYPEDYDGIISGAHGGDSTSLMAGEAWAAVAAIKNRGLGGIPVGKVVLGEVTPGTHFTALAAEALRSCDAIDGLVDGQIDDPRKCNFDPQVLLCNKFGASPESCLSPEQVQMVRDAYSGPKRSNGTELAPGYPVGSEAGWFRYWSKETDVHSASWGDFFRLSLKEDPEFDVSRIDWDRDVDLAFSKYQSSKDVFDPDLTPFADRGGKLIVYHGWADPLISPYLSVNFWSRLHQKMGDRVPQFARLFMVPAMGHCRGGPISNFDALGAIEKWVEQGVAPDATNASNTLIGRGVANGQPRSRPLCPYPQVARLKEKGLDPNLADSFVCFVGE